MNKKVHESAKQAYIEAIYNRVVDKATGGVLYGTPIDVDNVKELVAVAYMLNSPYDMHKESYIGKGNQ